MVQVRLLKPQGGEEALLQQLSIPVLGDTDLMLKVLLPSFSSLDEAACKRVLEWIVSHWATLKDHAELTAVLAETSFVTSSETLLCATMLPALAAHHRFALSVTRASLTDRAGNGQRHQPKELFDPSNKLLLRVFSGANVFPAAEFTTARWLPVRPVLQSAAAVALVTVIEAPDTGDLRYMDTLWPQWSHWSSRSPA